MKFIVDMPISPFLSKRLVERGHDAIHCSEVGLAKAADEEIMTRARSEGRIVITADLDFPRILALTQGEAPAVLLFRGGNYSEKEMQAMLNGVLDHVKEEDLICSVTVVEKGRIRRTRLPLRQK